MTRTRTGAAGETPARRVGGAVIRQSGSVLAAWLQVGLAICIAVVSIGLASIATIVAPPVAPPLDIVATMAPAQPSPPPASGRRTDGGPQATAHGAVPATSHGK